MNKEEPHRKTCFSAFMKRTDYDLRAFVRARFLRLQTCMRPSCLETEPTTLRQYLEPSKLH
ncbi:MAG: hypothetical protein HDQ87_05830 [Clostridia bacterium]|nr:hypothetical protein [Clostridia bacterium]